jgi:hypothetical protein
MPMQSHRPGGVMQRRRLFRPVRLWLVKLAGYTLQITKVP